MPKGHKPLRKISGPITFKLEYQRHLKVKTQTFGKDIWNIFSKPEFITVSEKDP